MVFFQCSPFLLHSVKVNFSSLQTNTHYRLSDRKDQTAGCLSIHFTGQDKNNFLGIFLTILCLWIRKGFSRVKNGLCEFCKVISYSCWVEQKFSGGLTCKIFSKKEHSSCFHNSYSTPSYHNPSVDCQSFPDWSPINPGPISHSSQYQIYIASFHS